MIWKLFHKEDSFCLWYWWTGYFWPPVLQGQPEKLTQCKRRCRGQQEANKSVRPWKRLGTQEAARSACATSWVSLHRAGKGGWGMAWTILQVRTPKDCTLGSQVARAYLQPSSQFIPRTSLTLNWGQGSTDILAAGRWYCPQPLGVSMNERVFRENICQHTGTAGAGVGRLPGGDGMGCSPGWGVGCGSAGFTGGYAPTWAVGYEGTSRSVSWPLEFPMDWEPFFPTPWQSHGLCSHLQRWPEETAIVC